ncbi:MAG: cupredoxin domain-containing protein [Candidatus Woesebacteria bacterium]|nr:MAG: cupredoxin domain-containing protein [Candidatus Woesebacteria bacterium]
MEENKENETKETKGSENSSNKSMLLVGGVIALIILAVPGFLIARKIKRVLFNSARMAASSTVSSSQEASSSPSVAGESNSVSQISIRGGSFYFKPDEIRVKVGTKVSILFTNDEGTHDFVIDEFKVKSETIKGGVTTTVEFTPDKTGTFEFYCSIGNHRQMGMKGKLIVE